MNPDAMRAEIKIGVTEINGEEYTRTYEEAFPMADWKSGRLDLFDGEEVIRSQPLFTPKSIVERMHEIEEENISDTGERAWKQLKQEMQDSDDETEAENQ